MVVVDRRSLVRVLEDSLARVEEVGTRVREVIIITTEEAAAGKRPKVKSKYLKCLKIC